ncbi:TrmH family RNA methyltransferase [Roseomonas elaeocarpi]|uniref:TrmH family RNA methyltransferase n=1 Tax=Roseomonas elaeocarpi TaxID=907779 RepID=A0ABV6JRL0_9PROT
MTHDPFQAGATPGTTPAATITSAANGRIKALRLLRERKGRAATGLFLAEGEDALRMALDAGRTVASLVFDPGRAGAALQAMAERCAAGGAEMIPAGPAVLAALSGRDNPPRVVAALPQPWVALDALPVVRPAAFAVLEAPRDPRNLGAVARSAEAAGVAGLILLGESCDPWGPDAVAASAGALLVLPVARAGLEEFARWRARHGVALAGTSLAAELDYRRAPYGEAVAVAMGTETTGLSEELAGACDLLVKIPMRGRVDSLNLAVAAGLMIFAVTEAQR